MNCAAEKNTATTTTTMMMTDKHYWYAAHVVSVYDGDTLRCDIDLGFGVCLRNQALRLYGLDTPELRGDERDAGLAAKSFVVDWLAKRGRNVTLHTHRDRRGKYGRWLAVVYGANGRNLNADLIAAGHARQVDY